MTHPQRLNHLQFIRFQNIRRTFFFSPQNYYVVDSTPAAMLLKKPSSRRFQVSALPHGNLDLSKLRERSLFILLIDLSHISFEMIFHL